MCIDTVLVIVQEKPTRSYRTSKLSTIVHPCKTIARPRPYNYGLYSSILWHETRWGVIINLPQSSLPLLIVQMRSSRNKIAILHRLIPKRSHRRYVGDNVLSNSLITMATRWGVTNIFRISGILSLVFTNHTSVKQERAWFSLPVYQYNTGTCPREAQTII